MLLLQTAPMNKIPAALATHRLESGGLFRSAELLFITTFQRCRRTMSRRNLCYPDYKRPVLCATIHLHVPCICSAKIILGSLLRAFSKIFFLLTPIFFLFQHLCCSFTDIVALLLLVIPSDPFADMLARCMQ